MLYKIIVVMIELCTNITLMNTKIVLIKCQHLQEIWNPKSHCEPRSIPGNSADPSTLRCSLTSSASEPQLSEREDCEPVAVGLEEFRVYGLILRGTSFKRGLN